MNMSKCHMIFKELDLYGSSLKLEKLCLHLWGTYVCCSIHVVVTEVCCLALAHVVFLCFIDLHMSGAPRLFHATGQMVE